MINLATVLTDSAREYPDQTALIHRDRRFTYKQIDQMSNQVANGLREAGIQRGEKVAFLCPNLPYFPMVYYGILKAGAAVVPLNVLLKKREIAYHLADADAVALICFEGSPELPLADHAWEAFNDVASCRHLWYLPAISGGASPIEGVKTFADLTADQPSTFATEQMHTEDTAVIIYTSGTTGQPKGAELTHSNLIMNAFISRDIGGDKLNEVLLVVLPLFHSYGQSVMMNAGFLGNCTLVLLERFDAAEVLRLMETEGVTNFSGVPTMYWEILRCADVEKYDIEKIRNTLRFCAAGGSAMPVEIMKAFEEKFDVAIVEGYGLSETSPVTCVERVNKERKYASVGQPIWGVDMRCVDENMHDVPYGEPGEIVIRGHNVMKGYYKRPDANAEAFRGGWFHTGDVGKIDEDGYFYIVDRTKDVIIRGGFNVYPREIEEVLVTHPAISLAAVIGIPNEEYGEEILAYVIPKPDTTINTDEIITWSKQEMAAYKYPRHVIVSDAFPLGPSGKILKTELRKDAIEKLQRLGQK